MNDFDRMWVSFVKIKVSFVSHSYVTWHMWHDSFYLSYHIWMTHKTDLYLVKRDPHSVKRAQSFTWLNGVTLLSDSIHSSKTLGSFDRMWVSFVKIQVSFVSHLYVNDSLSFTWVNGVTQKIYWLKKSIVKTDRFRWGDPNVRSLIRESCDMTWLSHLCDMTHSYVWHDSFICVTWLIGGIIRMMQHLYVWDASFICVWQWYGVAATSRLLKIKGLFCKRDL